MIIRLYVYMNICILLYILIHLFEYYDMLIFYYEYILILRYLFMPIFRPPDGPRMRYSEGTPFRLGCWLGLDRMGLVGVNISPDGD